MMTVYLVLISEPTTDTPSRNLGGREVWSYVFASLELAQRGVQIDHNNKRARRGLPPEALVWDDTIPKRPSGEELEDVSLRIEPVTEE